MTIYKYDLISTSKEKYFETSRAAIECVKKDVIEYHKKRGVDLIFDRTEELISSTTSKTLIQIYFNKADTNHPYRRLYPARM